MPKHENVDQYITDCTNEITPLIRKLRLLIHETLSGATEGMQYGVPTFINANGVPVIYLFGSKHHVNFGFLKSTEIFDPQGILQGSGKPSKHVKLFPKDKIDKTMLRKFIKQCDSLEA